MKKIFLAVFIMAATVAANRAYADIKIYMKLIKTDGSQINGESITTNFVNWVEVNATGFGHNTPITFTSGGSSVGKTTPTDFSFQVPVNASSLPLLTLEYAGLRLKSADVWYVQSGCNCAYYKIHMEDVFITGLTEADSTSTSIAQQFTFAPVKYAMAYYKQNPSTGSIPTTPTNTFGWDRAASQTFTYSF